MGYAISLFASTVVLVPDGMTGVALLKKRRRRQFPAALVAFGIQAVYMFQEVGCSEAIVVPPRPYHARSRVRPDAA